VRSKVRVLRNLHACSSGNHDKGTDDFPPVSQNAHHERGEANKILL